MLFEVEKVKVKLVLFFKYAIASFKVKLLLYGTISIFSIILLAYVKVTWYFFSVATNISKSGFIPLFIVCV